MSLDDVEGNGKSQPHPVDRHLSSEKRNEDLLHILSPDPCPVIRDSHEHLIGRAAIGAGFGLESSAMGQGIHGVIQKMDNRLMQLVSITPDEGRTLREIRRHLDLSFLKPSLHEPESALQNFVEINPLEFR